MKENSGSDVACALEMLLAEIETEIGLRYDLGARAFEKRDEDLARRSFEEIGRLTSFRDKVVALGREWDSMTASGLEPVQKQPARLPKGLRTPEKAYNIPILLALHEIGGRGSISDVLDRVGSIMKSTLKPVDYQPLRGSNKILRWRNTAQFARNTMVGEGLLEASSPKGIWEMSDRGRAIVKERSKRK